MAKKLRSGLLIWACISTLSSVSWAQSRGNPFRLSYLTDVRVQQALEMNQAQIQAVYDTGQEIEARLAEIASQQRARLRQLPPGTSNAGQIMASNAEQLVSYRIELNNLALRQILSAQQQQLLEQIITSGVLPPLRSVAQPVVPAPAERRAGPTYSSHVPLPDKAFQSQKLSASIKLEAPQNWERVTAGGIYQFSPAGAYGNRGITHGIYLGIAAAHNKALQAATNELVQRFLDANSYLHRRGITSTKRLPAGTFVVVTLVGQSPITNSTEVATVYTKMLADGNLFYAFTVVPKVEANSYAKPFQSVLESITISN